MRNSGTDISRQISQDSNGTEKISKEEYAKRASQAAGRVSRVPSKNSVTYSSGDFSYTALEATGEQEAAASSSEEEALVDDVFEGHAKNASLCPYLSFVNHPNFQAFIGSVIFSNVFTLWGETDFPDLFVWVIFDNIFLSVFVVEITLRIAYEGRLFATGKEKMWHLLDAIIVALGIWDLWLPVVLAQMSGGTSHLKVEESHHRKGLHRHGSVLRFLRLMRLLRLIRVFKMFPALANFVGALWDMLHKFVWIFLVLFFFIFCSSIVLTKLLGQSDFAEIEGLEEEIDFIRTHFRDVPSALFTLFQVTTCDNWTKIAVPVIRVNPYMRLFFIGFIVFASWILISVLTAVASDAMVGATSDKREEERKEQERAQLKFIVFLKDAFIRADTDGNGSMDKEEFLALMVQEFVHVEMRKTGINMTMEELLKAYQMLDIDGSGELTIDEFVSGFSYLREALCTKHVVNIDYSLKRFSMTMETRIERLCAEISEFSMENEEIAELMDRQDEMQKAQRLSLWLWQEWVANTGSKEDGAAYLSEPDMAPPSPTYDITSSMSVETGAQDLNPMTYLSLQ